jgi:arsenate reductase
MPDPAAVVGEEDVKVAAFYDALNLISRRIDLLLSLPIAKLERLVLEAQMQAIGESGLALGRAGFEEGAS